VLGRNKVVLQELKKEGVSFNIFQNKIGAI